MIGTDTMVPKEEGSLLHDLMRPHARHPPIDGLPGE